MEDQEKQVRLYYKCKNVGPREKLCIEETNTLEKINLYNSDVQPSKREPTVTIELKFSAIDKVTFYNSSRYALNESIDINLAEEDWVLYTLYWIMSH